MKEKQRYLKNVEEFCSQARNDWHCVYLVRRIASQHGMEFAQRLVTEPRFRWVFPAEILQQVHKRHLLVVVLVSSFLPFVLLWGVLALVWLLGDRPEWQWLGGDLSWQHLWVATAALGRLKHPNAWEEEKTLPPPAGMLSPVLCMAVPWQVQHSQANPMDPFLVCGERYRALRDAAGQVMMEGTAQGLLQAQVQPTPPSTLPCWPWDGSSSLVSLWAVSVPREAPGSLCWEVTWACARVSSLSHLHIPSVWLGQLWTVPCHILGSPPGLQQPPSSGICLPAPGHLPGGHCPVRCQGSQPSPQAAGRTLLSGSL